MIADFRKYMTMCAVVALSCVISYSAAAQFADTPCDPKYYETLESRAWLEAQREITQNQNLIFKPDSVLEYTCFDRQLKELADHAKDMFSETDRWDEGGVEVIEDRENSMDDSLKSLVGAALVKYDEANFGGNYLGGRFDNSAYDPDGDARGGDYTCEEMQKVWLRAKCMDFIDKAESDSFFTFADYLDGDKRYPPGSCGNNADWQGNIDKANATHADSWQPDDVNTYLDVLFPPTGCGAGATAYVRTGLTVTTKGRNIVEHVCVVPGCAWDSDSNSCQP